MDFLYNLFDRGKVMGMLPLLIIVGVILTIGHFVDKQDEAKSKPIDKIDTPTK